MQQTKCSKLIVEVKMLQSDTMIDITLCASLHGFKQYSLYIRKTYPEA